MNAKQLNEEKNVARDISCKLEYVKTEQVTNALLKIQKDKFHANSRNAQVSHYTSKYLFVVNSTFYNSISISYETTIKFTLNVMKS